MGLPNAGKIRTFVTLFLVLAATLANADDQPKYSDYIATLDNLDNEAFDDILIQEISDYLHRFPDAPDVDQMHFKIATIYHDHNDRLASFFASMEVIYLYPESPVVAPAQDRVRSLLVKEKKFKPLKDQADALIHPTLNDTSREASYYTFLQDMVDLRFDKIREQLLRGTQRYLRNYPDSERADAVLFWRAELLAQSKKPKQALSEYLKLTYVHSSSLYVTASKLKMADLFSQKLKDPKKAILTLEEFLLEFPDDPQASLAQLRIAKINEKKNKKYLEAINGYTAVAAHYPQSADAVPALFDAARLYEDKFKEYDQAIRVYTEIVRDFPNDIKAPHAYAEAARIYEKRLKDYFNAASVYFKVYGNYPESGIAPECLFAAAEINEKKLQDFDKALMYYRFVADNYPNHKLANKATKRIDKVSKKQMEQ